MATFSIRVVVKFIFPLLSLVYILLAGVKTFQLCTISAAAKCYRRFHFQFNATLCLGKTVYNWNSSTLAYNLVCSPGAVKIYP